MKILEGVELDPVHTLCVAGVRPRWPSLREAFSFSPSSVQSIDPKVETLLRTFQERLDDFAKAETQAKHVVAIFKKNDKEAIQGIDWSGYNMWAASFWQSKDWFWELRKIVPILIQELSKSQPKNTAALAKAHKFWMKVWKFAPKDPAATYKKYLSVLKELRAQLDACQKAAALIGGSAPKAIKVGKFEVFDGVGMSPQQEKAVAQILTQATQIFSRHKLGQYCYGKVTVIDASRMHAAGPGSRAAAFYVESTDEVFLSPDIGKEDLRVLCHELLHRVHTKRHLRQRSQDLYQTVKSRGTWITSYAKTNAEENFCEMGSFALLGKLPEDSVALLRSVLPEAG